MIAIAIGVCEVAFWVLLLGGLTARYALGRARLSKVLLVSVPLVDAVLLAVTAIDLGRGSQADGTHGLAALFLGFSIVFGPSAVAAADRRFAVRYGAAEPRPEARPSPVSRLAAHWRLWLRCLLACLVAATVLCGLMLVAGDPGQTRALWAGGGAFANLGVVSVAWLLFGPVWTAVAEHTRPTSPERTEPT